MKYIRRNSRRIVHGNRKMGGKTKGLGFFEKLVVQHRGRIDAAAGLAHQEDGHWTTPFVKAEQVRFGEFVSRQWGRLQAGNSEGFSRLAALMDQVKSDLKQIDLLTRELTKATGEENERSSIRYVGEEDLTTNQVLTRRETEKKARLTPMEQRLVDEIRKTSKPRQDLLEAYGALMETAYSTQLVVDRAEAHTAQRISAYWYQYLLAQGGEADLPMELGADLRDTVRGIYDGNHASILTEAHKLIERIDYLKEDDDNV